MIDFMPVSMTDFPGMIAATVFISGCSFHCPYCHNSSLIKSTKSDNKVIERFFRYLDERKGLIEGVCITGGEPTLWSGLADLILRIREKGLAVKLDTNGSSPLFIRDILRENLVDYIAMDIKAPLDKYHLFTKHENNVIGVEETAAMLLDSNINYEFRTTVHEKLLSLDDFDSMGRWLQGAPRYVLQGYRYSEDVLDPKFCGSSRCAPGFLKQIEKIIEPYFNKIVIRS